MRRHLGHLIDNLYTLFKDVLILYVALKTAWNSNTNFGVI
jgi:hypothetical protein